jgi:hypothetical protein
MELHLAEQIIEKHNLINNFISIIRNKYLKKNIEKQQLKIQ